MIFPVATAKGGNWSTGKCDESLQGPSIGTGIPAGWNLFGDW